ncbi:MAG: hypothetical protein LiPW15_231 [Parcubacteria group bacterium LiPW_15]|nr:MAG: hypothetical protein LiPW15_231 [Parcubacteria group bacterium LiPW_15]
MKIFFEKIVSALPYLVLLVIIGVLFIVVYQNGLTYDQFIKLAQVIAWPTVAVSALLFFKKVITYLFLSMEEFNFFGAKGELKNVQEVIEEKVQLRLREQKNEEEQKEKIAKINSQLEKAVESKSGVEARADANLRLAKDVVKQLTDLSEKHNAALKELDDLRELQAERNARRARNAALLERIRRRNEFLHNHSAHDADGALGEDEPK